MAPKTEENSRYSNTCPAVWGQRCQPAWENMFCWKCAGSNWFIVWTWSTQTHQLDETPLTFLSYRALFLRDYLWLASVAVTAAWLSGRHCWCPPRLSGRKCLYIYLMDCDEMLDRHSWPAAKENWLQLSPMFFSDFTFVVSIWAQQKNVNFSCGSSLLRPVFTFFSS